jgi:hypothetical protein
MAISTFETLPAAGRARTLGTNAPCFCAKSVAALLGPAATFCAAL